MKKIIKLLSILGVLMLLGSCGSSSKSVNVETVSASDIIVSFGVQDRYSSTYAISGFIKIEDVVTHEFKEYKKTDEVQGFMKANKKYDITWNMINTLTFELKSGLKYEDYYFSPVSRNIKFNFGIGDYAIEEE